MNTNHNEVLKVVNRTRKILGYKPLKKLPKGRIGSPNSCPLAVAFHSDYVEERYITFPAPKARRIKEEVFKTSYYSFCKDRNCNICTQAKDKLKTPKILKKFITNFDKAKYPELVRNN